MVLQRLWRRWTGGILLAVAAGMLLLGEFVLKSKLLGLTFVAYWLLCLVFTCLAILVALHDLRVRRQQARQEQQELIKLTVEEIQQHLRETPQRPQKAARREGGPVNDGH